MNKHEITVVGGGLAGSEAAWQIANRGFSVALYEMRPKVGTGAHTGAYLAELVCSNSLGSNLVDRASGLLKEELRLLESLLLALAEETAVPAGGALAVDRELFARRVTESVENHPNVNVYRKEITTIPDGPSIIASGPLTSEKLSNAIQKLTGSDHLYFYDAIAPIVNSETIDMSVAFRGSRYDRGEQDFGDYINCPFSRSEYEDFVEQLLSAERIELHEFEKELEQGVRAGAHKFFEGCLPIEIMARRGRDALAYGPMRPVGLIDPRTGKRPHAVVQLRQDNLAGTLYNLVGFQNNLKFSEQRRVLRLIPGLANASFERYGQMHRNTFIYSPAHLRASLQFRNREDLFFAGQITGVEGYMGNIATGLLAGMNVVRLIQGENLLIFPKTTMLGALCHNVSNADSRDYQPMKANFGIMSPLEGKRIKGKRQRSQAYSSRALRDLNDYIKTNIAYSHLYQQ